MKDNRKAPLVSVLMGVYYQREDLALLRRSVESILRQDWEDFEFLICDGGSRKEACRLLEDCAETDPRVRLIRPGTGRYDLATKLNACLHEARGSYIARMDDDDESHAKRLSKQLAALVAHPEIAFVGCNVRLFRANCCVGERRLPLQPEVRDFYFVQPYSIRLLFSAEKRWRL